MGAHRPCGTVRRVCHSTAATLRAPPDMGIRPDPGSALSPVRAVRHLRDDPVVSGMADTGTQIGSALGADYVIERELPGGMSRVFVARQRSLNRRVVIKLLPTDLASTTGAERFAREIQLLARLQHPHIVPVLGAGVVEGLPYYLMPFIEGESLGARLEREGPLPIEDVWRLLRELLDALAAAHAIGVVHRDMKPDNVLLAAQHAMITDFGIAKVLTDVGSTSLTATGLAIGTPLYMAPEQISGERTVDGRADLYAVGVIGYQLLTGEPPFRGSSATALLVAHVSQPVPSIAAQRPTTPPALEAFLQRLLEKAPADRYASATEAIAALDGARKSALVAPSATPIRSVAAPRAARGAQRWRIVVGVAALAGAAAFWWMRWGGGASPLARGTISTRDRILVADIGTGATDSTGRAITQLLRIGLAQSSAIRVVGRGDVREVLARMQRPPETLLDEAVTREIAMREGLKAFVTGDIVQAGAGFVLDARLVESATGEVLVTVRESARSAAELIAAVDRLAARLREGIGESLAQVQATPPLASITTGSLEALRHYAEAERISAIQGGEEAIPLLDQAIAADSQFAMAWRRKGVILSNPGQPPAMRARGDSVLKHALTMKQRLPERERLMLEGSVAALNERTLPAAIAAYRALVARYPDDQTALNNLASSLARAGRSREELPILEQLMRLPTATSLSYQNYLLVLAEIGSPDQADSVKAALASRFEGQFDAYVAHVELALRQQRFDEADTLVARLLRGTPSDRTYALVVQRTLLALRGHFTEASRSYRQSLELRVRRGAMPAAVAPLVGDLDELAMRATFTPSPDADRRRLRTLWRDLSQTAPNMTSNPMVARQFITAFATLGAATEAREVLNAYETVMARTGYPAVGPRVFAIEGRARVLLAERRPEEAQVALDEATAAGIDTYAPYRLRAVLPLATLFEQRGQRDSALAVYERFVTLPMRRGMSLPGNVDLGTPLLPLAWRRIGELREARGDTTGALAAYDRFLAFWATADASVQPIVTGVRTRAAALRRARG
jgi:eukaryotic-like serine/threonine-protein kinase